MTTLVEHYRVCLNERTWNFLDGFSPVESPSHTLVGRRNRPQAGHGYCRHRGVVQKANDRALPDPNKPSEETETLKECD